MANYHRYNSYREALLKGWPRSEIVPGSSKDAQLRGFPLDGFVPDVPISLGGGPNFFGEQLKKHDD